MMLYIAQVSGSPIVDISGSSIDFSVDITNKIANITAVGYLVDVSITGTIAHIRWYQSEYPSTIGYFTHWDSQEGLRITGATMASVGTYSGGTILDDIGFNPANDPGSTPNNLVWYTGSTAGGTYFKGYTFHCPLSGYYNVYCNTVYLGGLGNDLFFNIDYSATLTVSIAGQSSTSSDSYSGLIKKNMTQHTGFNVQNVLLISGTFYAFQFDVDITINSLPQGDPSPSQDWTIWTCDPDNPPTLFYMVTGTV